MYGTPGYTFNDVYTMPIHLRNFYFREYTDLKKKENDEIKKSQQKSTPTIPRRFSPK